jgi:hypothetical protein
MRFNSNSLSSAPTAKCSWVRQPILPGADSKKDPEMWYVNEGRKFEVPRSGKTIRVRAQKSGKILHKFTWNGEKFVEQK